MGQDKKTNFSHFEHPESATLTNHVVSFEDACVLTQHFKKQGEKVVFTSGVFDILHTAHAHFLSYLEKRADILIVGIDDNVGVQKIKGESSPLFDEQDRAMLIANLKFVNFAFIFPGAWGVQELMLMEPDFVGIPSYDPNMRDKIKKLELAGIEPIITPPFLRNNSSSRKARQIHTDYLITHKLEDVDE